MKAVFLCFLFTTICYCAELRYQTPIGTFITEQGEETTDFLAIPYARPLNKTNRWTVPLGYALSSSQYYFCKEKGPICPQRGSLQTPPEIPRSEDCLTLNIRIPTTVIENSQLTEPSPKLAVMVFIHGGAFVIGSNNDPYISAVEFNRKNVILVSINYRLGVFGFPAFKELQQEDMNAENLGLLDQRLAIKWVLDNIHHFGGDRERVSIFGESAGAMSITWHLSVDESDFSEEDQIINKLSGVAIQSAANLDYISCEENHEMQRKTFSVLGCDAKKGKEYLACLRDIDFQVFIDTLPGFGSFRKLFWHTSSAEKYSFVPCVSSSSIFKMDPRDYFVEERAKTDMNVLIGTTKDEGTLFTWLTFLFHANVPLDTLESFIRSGFSDLDDDDEAAMIMNTYFPVSQSESFDAFPLMSEIINDVYFQCGTKHFADHLAKKHATYRYVFDYLPSSGKQSLGVYHAAELPFVFGKPVGGGLFPDTFDDNDAYVANKVNQYWVNFAKYGSPNDPHTSIGENTFWARYNDSSQFVQILGHPIRNETKYKSEICHFWETMYPVGVPFLGDRDEMVHEKWDTYIINETAFLLVRNKRVVKTVIIVITLSTLFSIIWCIRGKKQKSKQE